MPRQNRSISSSQGFTSNPPGEDRIVAFSRSAYDARHPRAFADIAGIGRASFDDKRILQITLIASWFNYCGPRYARLSERLTQKHKHLAAQVVLVFLGQSLAQWPAEGRPPALSSLSPFLLSDLGAKRA
jgi:hypothetical protein